MKIKIKIAKAKHELEWLVKFGGKSLCVIIFIDLHDRYTEYQIYLAQDAPGFKELLLWHFTNVYLYWEFWDFEI